jgi:hypothetical protein
MTDWIEGIISEEAWNQTKILSGVRRLPGSELRPQNPEKVQDSISSTTPHNRPLRVAYAFSLWGKLQSVALTLTTPNS